jgi:hypothetical protein
MLLSNAIHLKIVAKKSPVAAIVFLMKYRYIALQ